MTSTSASITLDYKVLTGHASAYWASPFASYDAAVHVGRYLARDIGATFEVRRTFTNGWMVGGFFTLTDVPFEEFGEGSFDKGLFFRIPFNSLLPGNTRGAYQTIIRTIQRDGGARLEGIGDTLWWEGRGHRPDFDAKPHGAAIMQTSLTMVRTALLAGAALLLAALQGCAYATVQAPQFDAVRALFPRARPWTLNPSPGACAGQAASSRWCPLPSMISSYLPTKWCSGDLRWLEHHASGRLAWPRSPHPYA